MFRIRVVLSCFSLCTAALAADLKVTVHSPSGDRVSGVQVSLFRAADNAGVAVQTTGGDGSVNFPASRRWRLSRGHSRSRICRTVGRQLTFPALKRSTVQLKLTTTPQTVVVSATATPATVEQIGDLGRLSQQRSAHADQPRVGQRRAELYMPGAIVSDAGRRGGLSSLFVRGGESNYNKVIIDGVPVNEPGGTFDFGVVPMDNVERLEMVRGPESTIYGSDAMTSTVQLWTATGDTRTPEMQFGADGGNFSTANGYASISGAHGIYDYNAFADSVHHPGARHQRRLFQFAAGRQRRHSPVGPCGVSLAPAPLQQLHRRAVGLVVQRQSRASAGLRSVGAPEQLPGQRALTITGPGAWQHQIHRLRVQPSAANTDTIDDPGRPFDSPSTTTQGTTARDFPIRGSGHRAVGR